MANKNNPAIKVKFLPVDIEENILSRVPVKTILRFMSVCKLWYSVFLDPRFKCMHGKNGSNTLLLARLQMTKELIVTDTSSVIHSRLRLFENPQLDLFLRQSGHVFNYERHKNNLISCKGIVCVYGIRSLFVNEEFCEHICLWNPALKVVKYIQIPDIGHVGNTERVLVGFEFDSDSNDYKVIRYQENVFRKETGKVEIYSLSSDTWRTVNGATRNITDFFRSHYCHARTSSVYVKETHHWAVVHPKYQVGQANSAIIVSFNLRTEVLKTATVPNEICKRNALKMFLFNYKESLATLTFGDTYWGSIDHKIWVMLDCGISESWIKVCKIELPQMVYCRGFNENNNELIFSRSHLLGQSRVCSIVFDIDKLEMKDDCSTSNMEILNDAVELVTLRESSESLDSNNLSNNKVSNNCLEIFIPNAV